VRGARAVAALCLLAALAVLALWPRHGLQLALFDAYQRAFPRQPASQPAVIVGIDEATLADLGQWPWPRHFLAALIDAIAAAQPATVGLDMFFPEADRASPARLAENRPDLPEGVRAALAAATSNDALLAASLAAAPSVLASAGFRESLPGANNPILGAETVTVTAAPPALRSYAHILASIPELQRAARGRAVVNAEPEDGVARRVPLVVDVAGRMMPTLAVEMQRMATPQAAAVELSAATLRIGALDVPLDKGGQAWVYYSPRGTIPVVSALEVLQGGAADRLRGRHVLVGLTAHGLVDQIATPLGDIRPGVEIHAQLLGAFADGRLLRRPAALQGLEFALLLGGAAAMIVWLPRQRPRRALVLGLAAILGVGAGGFALFATAGLLLDAATVGTGFAAVLASLIAGMTMEADRQKRQAEAALQKSREEAARIAGELAAAHRIQLGSLPRPNPAERRFDIAATLEPARDVGGDLYDFYAIDAQRLFFVVGDVSGKGLPASLFMVVAKALAKSVTLRGTAGVAAIVSATGREIARENPESLFVTLVAGILDMASGEVELCNAGHDAPWKLAADGKAEHLQVEGGPPLCVLDDFAYGATKIRLDPGDTLCLVTDGITEAMDSAGRLYGIERFAAVLAKGERGGTEVTARMLVDRVRADVAAFVGDAEPADDLTLLALRWTPQRT
jgi:serine phosphatase RsbU (regulator of sigma subunit)/CHASE2 domain-containing sensor protein